MEPRTTSICSRLNVSRVWELNLVLWAWRAVVAWRAVAVWTTVLVRHDIEAREVLHVHVAQHVLGVSVNLDAILDHEIHSRNVRDVVETLLALLFLQLEGDPLDRSSGNALHHVGGEPSNLVAKALAWDHRHLIANALVGVEVQGEALVIALNHLLGSTLDGLVANAAHVLSCVPC